MKLPAPIQAYFKADQASGDTPPLTAFAANASVKDDGHTHVGHTAIATWWRAAKAQYQHHATPREFSQTGRTSVVRAEVSGEFPGSPALLTFRFKLAGAQIETLEIGA